MHSFMRALGAATLLVTAANAPLAAQAVPQKFAYVDTRKILDQAPGRPEAEAQLSKEVTLMQDNLKKLGDQITQMMADYTKLPATTPQAEKDKREKAIRDKQAEAQQKQDEFQQQAQQRQAELLQPILDQIKLVLEDLRAENNYTMLFDVGQGASIVAADKNLDISDRVIAKLRTMPKPVIAAAKADGSKPDAKKPAGAPLNAPAGVRPPGSSPPPAARKPDSTATKKPDSTATKKPDSTATKKPDSTATKKPDERAAATSKPSGA